MSVKLNFLNNHFAQNGDLIDEKGECFHQTLGEFYQGRCDKNMMADHGWILIRNSTNAGTPSVKLFPEKDILVFFLQS